MIKKTLTLAGAISLLSISVQAQFSMGPLTTFSPNNDGWLAPGEGGITYVSTGGNQRGLDYGNGHLYVVNRNSGSSIVRLDGSTGGNLGTPLNLTGISGGLFTINKIAVADDGAIYVANVTSDSATSPLKVYRWANDSAVPTLAYSGNAGLPGSRVGDSLAINGSGSSTALVLGYSSVPAVPGNSGYSIVNPTASTSTAVQFAGTPPSAGDFRQGLTFGPSGQVWGIQRFSTPRLRETSYSGTTGTMLGTASGMVSNAELAISFGVFNGLAVIATIDTDDATVRVYDASNPLVLQLMGSRNNTSGTLTINPNGTGDVAWGDAIPTGDGRVAVNLYALSSNQGIQAFAVIVPEPSMFSILGLGLGAWISRRRFRK